MDGGSTGLIAIESDVAGYVVDKRKLRALARTTMKALGVGDHELAVTLTGSTAIKKLNNEYRGKNKPTDVLSFPQASFKAPLRVEKPHKSRARGPKLLGDVIISLPEAAKNAKSIGQKLDREVCFLLVHGILHLCGHDHMEPDEEEVMLAQQDVLMSRLAKGRAGPRWLGAAKLPRRAGAAR